MGPKVRDAMATQISTAALTDTVGHVAELMKHDDTGFIPVCEGDRLVGVVTDRDIVLRCLAEGHENPAAESIDHVVSHSPLTVDANADLDAAAELMGRAAVRRLAVVDDGDLVGVLSHGNLIQATKGASAAAQQATVGVTRGA
jgi:CBS domain-containing protein